MGNAPLKLTLNPRLDAALAAGCEAWETAAREHGLDRTAAWATRRAGPDVPKDDLRDHLEALLDAVDDDEIAIARAELAELVEENDDDLAEALWTGVLEYGRGIDDGETVFEATARLAGIVEDFDDPLGAAELYVDFLNWRREADHACDPEFVQTAFDEIIRLAEIDGAPEAAALFTFRQVQFTKIAESEAESATTGEWNRDRAPYTSWS